MTALGPAFIQFGDFVADLESGRSVDVADQPLETFGDIADLLDRLPHGIGLIIQGNVRPDNNVLCLKPDLRRDLIELVRKSGFVPDGQQNELEQHQEACVDDGLGDKFSVVPRRHSPLLLLALPLKDCMPTPGTEGGSS